MADIIPLRPVNDSDFSAIKPKEKDLLSLSVILGWSNERVYAMFHPESLDARGKLNYQGKKQCAQFFDYARHREYCDAYRETLLGLTAGGLATTGNAEISESRKDDALKSLLDKAMRLVESGTDLDAESLKVISDIFRKLNLIGDEVETQIKPLRFLPQRCSSCRMRIFVESAVANGEVLDMCAYCKCRKLAEEHGHRFNDGKDLLEIPKEVIAELESKNNVKLEDILSGKVEN